MVRLFERHRKRKVFSLDGIWQYKLDPARKGEEEGWFRNFPEDCGTIVVPSCLNHEIGLINYVGTAWYSVSFTTSRKNINLKFHAVSIAAKVYLDGVYLGSHYGGFTGFNFTVRDLTPGTHHLVVQVDNTINNTDSIPLIRMDWHNYAGITRSVEVEELEETWIKDYQIDYQLDRTLTNAKLDLKLTLESLDASEYSRMVNVYIGDDRLYSVNVCVKGETGLEIKELALNHVKLWDIGKPNLYDVRLETEDDDVIDRIGFRQVKVENRKVVLNGKEVLFKGVNRHEDHPDWGFAIPLQIMKKDMEIIKKLGCNAIRGSHYPNAEAFLDLCDQEGMLFWEEIPIWQYYGEQLTNPLVIERGLNMLEEMIKRDYHHPSIIIWSVLNECDSGSQEGYDLIKLFSGKVREMDKTRLITYASDRPMADICFSLVDIVSINKYFEWYEGVKEDWPVFFEAFKKELKNKGVDDKPIIVSEYGVEALFGETSFDGFKWTEDYQENYLNYVTRVILNDPELSGAFVWQFCDILSASDINRVLMRPRCCNNKGIVNEYRKPKKAYWAMKKIFET